jgi:hypothetical protein
MDNMLIMLFICCCCCCCLISSSGSFYYKNKESPSSESPSSDKTSASNKSYSTIVAAPTISPRGQICKDLQKKYPSIMYTPDSVPIDAATSFTTNKCSDYFIYGDK